MSRSALGALVVLFLSTAALADGTQRYFVATTRPGLEVAGNAIGRDAGPRRVAEFRLVRGFAADLTPSEAEDLRRSPGVRWIEPVVARHLLSTTTPGQQTVPYGITRIGAPQVWTARRSVAVNVAVIDSGIDNRHPDLRVAWAGGHSIFDPADSVGLDDIGHGTHVAGIIAATNNSFGVVGIAPGTRLWSVRAFQNADGTMENVLQGLEWVVQKKKELGGRWIVNMSLGGDEASEAEREAFRRAADEGIVLVAAAGNESFDTDPKPVSYPGAYESVIAVAATDEADAHAYFSNRGPEVDFSAPGVKVVSTDVIGQSYLSYVRNGSAILLSQPLDGSKAGSATGEYVYCGLGKAGDFPPSVRGRIALIQRGVETFADKARRAKEAGAVGVIIFNNDNSSAIRWTLYPAEDPDAKNYDWPVVHAISRSDGEALVAQGGGKITIALDSDDYVARTGTSMSCPHVVGALALLWSLAPNATPATLYQALAVTAKDLGTPGRDDLYGNGLIDLFAAAKLLAPEAFVDSGTGGRSTGRRFLTRH